MNKEDQERLCFLRSGVALRTRKGAAARIAQLSIHDVLILMSHYHCGIDDVDLHLWRDNSPWIAKQGRSIARQRREDPRSGLIGSIDEDICPTCGGEGFYIVDTDNCDDPVNAHDWRSGANVGDMVKCPNCKGSGKISDCDVV